MERRRREEGIIKKNNPLSSNDAPTLKNISKDDVLQATPTFFLPHYRLLSPLHYRKKNLRRRISHLDSETDRTMCSELESSSSDNHGYSTRSKHLSGDQKKCEEAISNKKMDLSVSETARTMCSELESESSDNRGYSTRSRQVSGGQEKCEEAISNEKMDLSDSDTARKMCSELVSALLGNHGYSTRSKQVSGDQEKCEEAISNEKMDLSDSVTSPAEDKSVSTRSCSLVSDEIQRNISKKGTAGKNLKVIKNEPTSVSVKNSSDSQLTENQTCPLCKEVFSDNHAFTLHIRKHNASNNDNACSFCSKKLSSASSLDRHSYVHSREKPFKCAICQTDFTTNGNMHRHMRTHGKQTHSEIENNEEDETANPTKKLCKRNVEKEKEKNEKIANTENIVFKTNLKIGCDTHYCSVCSMRFISEESLKSHMVAHENVNKCKDCLEQFKAQTTHVCKFKLNWKMNRNHWNAFKNIDFIAFSSNKFPVIANEKYKEQAIQRTCRSLVTFECQACSSIFPCKRTLEAHELTHDFCSVCKCPFSSPKCFHKSIHKTTEDAVESDKDNFLARLYLKKVTNSSTASERSTSLILSEDDMLQDYPGVTNKIQGDINKTQNFQTENSNDFADIPDIISRTSNATFLNMRTSPAAVDIIISEDETFSTESHIKQTISNLSEISSGDNASSNRDSDANNDVANRKWYKCKHCPLNFDNPKALKGHARCHSQNGPHCCDFCSYTSVDKSTLSRHMRTHNGERPFKCSICDYAFTTKANSHRHVKKKHKIQDDQVASYVEYNPNMLESCSSQTASNSKDETICKYCGKDFHFSRVLKHHLRSVNNSCSLKPYTCQRCRSGFSTKNNCIRHISAKHPEFKEKVQDLIIIKQTSANNQNNQPHVSYSANNEASTEEDESSTLCIVDYEIENIQEPPNQVDMEEEILAHEDNIEENGNEQENDGNLKQTLTAENPSSEVTSNLPHTFKTVHEVGVAETLVDLLGFVRVSHQAEPLDLSVRAIDLSSKNESIEQRQCDEIYSRNILNSNALESEASIKPPLAHSQPVMTEPLHVEQALHNFVTPMNLIKNNSSQFLTCHMSPINIPQSVAASSPCTLNSATNGSAGYTSNDEGNSQNACMSQLKLVKRKLVSNEQSYKCDYCEKKFTLKSNKERHVKKQHPEFARPARSRNYIPFFDDVLKPLQNVSDSTKSRLRSVLMPKVNSSNGNRDDECTSDLRGESVLAVSNENIEVEKSGDLMDQNSRNDFENSDLASVPSLIHAANSQVFNFTDSNVFAFHSSPEKVSSSESEIEDSKFKNSTFTCEYCGLTFPWLSAFKRHITTHTGDKRYHCPECSAGFTTKSNCDRHLKKQRCDKPTSRVWKTTKELHNGQSSKWKSPNSKNEFQSQSNINNNLNSHEIISNRMNGPHVVDQQQNDSLSNIPENPEVTCGGATLSSIAHEASLRFQSLCLAQQELECKFCKNTYKNKDDLTNHMKELHLLEYQMVVGEDLDQSLRTRYKSTSSDSGTGSNGNVSDHENLINELLGVQLIIKNPTIIDKLTAQ